MKTKKINKKLELNKKTVSNLNDTEMNHVKGALFWTDPRACDTDFTCSDFTWNQCPTEFCSVYKHTCCTICHVCP